MYMYIRERMVNDICVSVRVCVYVFKSLAGWPLYWTTYYLLSHDFHFKGVTVLMCLVLL